jgi:NAD(P) transhydrogenase subunit alpha
VLAGACLTHDGAVRHLPTAEALAALIPTPPDHAPTVQDEGARNEGARNPGANSEGAS